MQVVYIFLCVLIAWEIVHRRIDFVSIAAASFILYSSNCIIGEVWVPQSGHFAYFSQILLKTYLLVCVQMLIIYLFLLLKRKKVHFVLGGKDRKHEDERFSSNNLNSIIGVNNDNKPYWVAILIIAAASIVYNLFFKIRLATFFSYIAKADILEETSFLFSLSIWGGLVCFFHFYIIKSNVGTFISALIILISVLLGSRAYIATVLVGVLIIKSFGWRKKNGTGDNKKRNRRIIVLAIIMLLFLILYKLVYKEIRAGDFSAAISVLAKPETWKNLFDIDELRIVLADYNYTIEHGLKLPLIDVVARFVSIVPFFNDFIPTENPIRFSTILKNEMHTSYGLGSNFWGESYAMGGFLLLLVVTIAWLVFINKLNERVRVSKSPFVITVVSYLSFYIHRLDWTQVMGCFKLVLIFYFIKLAFDSVVKRSLSYSSTMKSVEEGNLTNG